MLRRKRRGIKPSARIKTDGETSGIVFDRRRRRNHGRKSPRTSLLGKRDTRIRPAKKYGGTPRVFPARNRYHPSAEIPYQYQKIYDRRRAKSNHRRCESYRRRRGYAARDPRFAHRFDRYLSYDEEIPKA